MVVAGVVREENVMEIHTVTGKLAGTFHTTLASCEGKRLTHSLVITSDGSWSNEFCVERGGNLRKFSGLAAASREYDRA